jgi:hypothetical protein
MATAIGGSKGVSAASRRWRIDRAFYTGLSIVMVVAVFAGFSRSYYLKGLYGTPALPTLFHVHGLLFTAWMVLLVVQTSLVVQTNLVASRRLPVHRQLGVAGGVLAGLMTALVAMVVYDLVSRGRPHAATVGGGLFLIATQVVRTTAGATAAWLAFARVLAR